MQNILRVTLLLSTAIGITLSFGFYLFRDQVIAVFLNDEEVIRYGSIMIIGTMIGGPFQGLLQLSISFLQGTGSVGVATGFTLLRQLIHVLLLIMMNVLFGFMGLVFSSSATTILCTATGVFLCFLQIRKQYADSANQQTETPTI